MNHSIDKHRCKSGSDSAAEARQASPPAADALTVMRELQKARAVLESHVVTLGDEDASARDVLWVVDEKSRKR